MKIYSAYGLVFESELDLEPLTVLEHISEPQVNVRVGHVSPKGIKNIRESRAFAQISETQVWLDIPDICRMQISNGNEILIDAYEGADKNADEQSIRLYVLGSGMGAILHQRGFLVLHANAVRLKKCKAEGQTKNENQAGGAVLFAGVSGAGKSTTAAVFHQLGFDVISDDVVALDDRGNIVGGFPQIKLWEDTLDKLGVAKSGLNLIRNQVNKYSFPLEPLQTDLSLPIKAVYFLRVANEQNPDEFELLPLEGIAKFNHLKAHTYRRHFMEGLGLKTQHMKLCGEIANRAHMAKIIRPDRRFNARELADFVLQDLENSGVINDSGVINCSRK